jgi:hypothetical protein
VSAFGDWLSTESNFEKQGKLIIKGAIKTAVPKLVLFVILLAIYLRIADLYGTERAFVCLGIVILLMLMDIEKGVAEIARKSPQS